MAQTGFTPIVTYNTATATTVPSAANLAQGELAVNVTDKKLYTKDSGGNVVLLASNGGDVTGPASSTNLAIPTFSGTGGKTLLNNSGATITAGVITATGFAGPLNGTLGATTPSTAVVTSINKMAITAPATSSTLAVADGKTLTANKTLTLDGTDSTTQTFPTTSATIARTDAAQTFTGAQTFSNAIIPSQTTGITGTTTNNDASAGYFGEYVSSTVLTASAVTINYGGSGVPVTSISLTAGDWDVEGWVGYNQGALSVVTYLIQGISTSNTSITGETSNVFRPANGGASPQIPIPVQRVSIASTTTIYLNSATGGSGTVLTAYGTIRARRIR